MTDIERDFSISAASGAPREVAMRGTQRGGGNAQTKKWWWY